VLINIVVDLVDALALLAARRRREVGTAATVLATGIAICAMRVGVAGHTACPRPVTVRRSGDNSLTIACMWAHGSVLRHLAQWNTAWLV
jgi:hypothetical protein